MRTIIYWHNNRLARVYGVLQQAATTSIYRAAKLICRASGLIAQPTVALVQPRRCHCLDLCTVAKINGGAFCSSGQTGVMWCRRPSAISHGPADCCAVYSPAYENRPEMLLTHLACIEPLQDR
jgi:hypothetical protein